MSDLSQIYENNQDSGQPAADSRTGDPMENALYDAEDQVSENPVDEQGDYYQQLADQARAEEADPDQAPREKAWGNSLRNEYGTAYDSNIGSAKAMIQDIDQTGELKAALDETRAGSHPGMVKFLVQVARQLGY